ncbi:hypothetical protein C0993_004486 [Termitomyces sp. T159_Od127]|nr:hypothetical protein C0993_004486 [Termitomyces sp. T159_Od127]
MTQIQTSKRDVIPRNKLAKNRRCMVKKQPSGSKEHLIPIPCPCTVKQLVPRRKGNLNCCREQLIHAVKRRLCDGRVVDQKSTDKSLKEGIGNTSGLWLKREQGYREACPFIQLKS